MKSNKLSSAGLLCLTAFLAAANFLSAGEIKKTFTDVSEIRIKTVSGDCIVEKGAGNEVKLVITYTYDKDSFEPEIEKRGRLNLTEEFFSRRSSGRSTWKLTVPNSTDIMFSTASGDFEVHDLQESEIEVKTASGRLLFKNVKADVKAGTASGDVEIDNLEGNLELGTASGDVTIMGATGNLEIGTASGRIDAQNLNGHMEFGTASGGVKIANAAGSFEVGAASGDVNVQAVSIEARSKFEAASGDVHLTLAKSPAEDLKVSTASGDAMVNFNGHAIKGSVEMTAQARLGRIRAPFQFDNEDYYWRGDEEYVTRIVRRGEGPVIQISTASGRAELQEN